MNDKFGPLTLPAKLHSPPVYRLKHTLICDLENLELRFSENSGNPIDSDEFPLKFWLRTVDKVHRGSRRIAEEAPKEKAL